MGTRDRVEQIEKGRKLSFVLYLYAVFIQPNIMCDPAKKDFCKVLNLSDALATPVYEEFFILYNLRIFLLFSIYVRNI